jgi:hypothetical protein
MKRKNRGDAELMGLLIWVGILALIAGIAMLMPEDNQSAIETAEASGFSNVKVTSTHRFLSADLHGCGDWKATELSVTNPAGSRANITVCEGLFLKGGTIRHHK